MKGIICCIVSIFISVLVGVDTVCSVFKEIPSRDADYYIDPIRQTSALQLTFTTQLIILGIAAMFIVIGIIADRNE